MSSPGCVGGCGRPEPGHQQSPGLQVLRRGSIVCHSTDLPLSSHHPVNGDVEQESRHHTALPHSNLHLETVVATSHFVCEVAVKALDEKDDFLWDSICTEYALKAFPVDADKVDVELSLPFCALIDDVTQYEDLVCASSTLPETRLFLSKLLVYSIR